MGVGYGISSNGFWCNEVSWIQNKEYNPHRKATESEVFEALKKEAVKRGFVDGVKFKSSLSEDGKTRTVYFKNESCFDFYASLNRLNCVTTRDEWDFGQSNPTIFQNGVWSEIIKERTFSKSEAEAKLNELINDDYTYKIG